MDIGGAITNLRAGVQVARMAWNMTKEPGVYKGDHLSYTPAHFQIKHWGTGGDGQPQSQTYQASTRDLMAEDWIVVHV